MNKNMIIGSAIVLTVSFAVSIYAQDTLWNQPNAKVIGSYKRGRSSKVADKALKVSEKRFGSNLLNMEPTQTSAMATFQVSRSVQTTLRVTGLIPVPGSVSVNAPGAIVATFSKELLPTSINDMTFRLIGSGSDGVFGNGNDMVVAANYITLSSSTEARFDLTGVPLADDVYQVTLAGDIGAITDFDAELLAMEISGELLPPPSLYEQIHSDLIAIRQAYPAMTSIHHRLRWVPGELLVGLTPEAMQQFNNGDYHGLDSLNSEYEPVEMIPNYTLLMLLLRFEQRYNPEYLAPLYAAAEGVTYAEPNRLMRDGNDIDVSMLYYTFSVGWGDCMAGCIFRHYWIFYVVGGSAVLVYEYGDPLDHPLLPSIIFDLEGKPMDGEFSGTFPSGDDIPGGDFVCTFTIVTGVTQTIPIKHGMLNMISLNVVPLDSAIDEVMRDLETLLVAQDDDGKFYIPPYAVNTIMYVRQCRGYQVFITGAEDDTLHVTGYPIIPHNCSKVLNNTKLYMICYPYQRPHHPSEVFADILVTG